MAKCDLWACFSQLWVTEDVEARLRNQLEAYQARSSNAIFAMQLARSRGPD
jgi:hypothetical protein